MGGDDVTVSVSFDDIFDGLDGLFEFPLLAEGLVCFAGELLCALFGLAVDACGVALGLHQQGFGLGVDIFRPDVAFLPLPFSVVFGLLEDGLGHDQKQSVASLRQQVGDIRTRFRRALKPAKTAIEPANLSNN